MGGMLTEEVKRVLMGQEQLQIPLYYNLAHPDRFTYERGELKHADLSKKKVLMIGNSHTRQTAKALACQYAKEISMVELSIRRFQGE